MKICFCIGSLKFSGAENVIRYVAEQLIIRGYDVSAILMGNMPEKNEIIDNLKVENAIVLDKGIIGICRRINKIRSSLKKIKPDIFIIFNFSMAYTAIPATKGFKGLKVVACERNDPISVPRSKKRRYVRDFLFKHTDVCVSQTETIANYFRPFVKNNYVIPNPLRANYVKCSRIEERKKIFATVARLDDYQKNQSMMIRAFAKVLKIHPEYQLHFLGAGNDLEKYIQLVEKLGIEKSVKFLGDVSSPLETIKNYRAFLLTSNYEGMPNALMEAMAIGLPCISTDCNGGGAKALIRNGYNGIIIKRNDEEALERSILNLITDEQLCTTLGDNAYRINETLYGENIVDMWEDLCILLCKGEKNARYSFDKKSEEEKVQNFR